MPEQAYIYRADIYCEACGDEIKAALTAAGKAPKSHDDESSFDSDDFPKGPYDNGGGEADSFQHCAECRLFLDNPLTDDGVDYTIDALKEYVATTAGSVDVLDQWAAALEGFSLEDDRAFGLISYNRVRKLEIQVANFGPAY